MSKLLTLGAAVSAAAAAAQASQATDETPFAQGFNAIAEIVLTGVTGAPTIKIQTSDDDAAWTDVLTVSALTRNVVKAEVALKKHVRLNVTAAGTAGTVDAYIHA